MSRNLRNVEKRGGKCDISNFQPLNTSWLCDLFSLCLVCLSTVSHHMPRQSLRGPCPNRLDYLFLWLSKNRISCTMYSETYSRIPILFISWLVSLASTKLWCYLPSGRIIRDRHQANTLSKPSETVQLITVWGATMYWTDNFQSEEYGELLSNMPDQTLIRPIIDLIDDLTTQDPQRQLEVIWILGHHGIAGNEHADADT